MKINKLLALVLTLLMTVALLAGCGGNDSAAMDMPAADEPAAEAPAEDYVVMDEAFVEESGLSSSTESATSLPQNQKIITTLHLDAQTENMDPLLTQIDKKVNELGGYMESQEIYNGSSYNSYRYRYAYLTIRIPADKLNSFVTLVSENANIVSQSTTTENVTLSYVAVESRITALETEEARLLELLAQAENMEDLLLIESRLTEVQSELEQYTSQLRVYDNRINYSTIYLNLEEVKEYTPVEEEPETVWERISEGFSENLENVGEGLVDFFVGLIVILPYLIPLAVIAAVVLAIVLSVSRKKKKNQKEPPAPSEQK